MKNYIYSIDFSVRDYECDMQGIVNNSVYQNYLEHARHEYLKSVGINFADLAKQGINLVVVRVELDYRYSLKSGDSFSVRLRVERESLLKFAFFEDIYRNSDDKLILQGKIIGTGLNARGRPEIPQALEKVFAVQPAPVTA